ncbi:hypothetical protein PPTG_03470 [Phytophthora nicotianae INRA-310]|uniref:Uncharacterized protein n=1 Tax=Phytophthora nicotianae (strain INRA-310) TaxID=761204 RepID=W2R516_PHYN3|nr:hypothetical protein PPTG_03470 [Phytophthora nicotianae INRA-310]ETN20473.1 hypothetical protein PPTG_03470 [Phytophthora nicotianae INRA-310]
MSPKTKPLKYSSEGVLKNWNGKDWQTYKWALMHVFKEQDLKDIAVGDLTKAMLTTASAEKKEEFEKKQLKIMRLIGTSVPADVLHQIRDKKAGSEMWSELCNLYEGKQSEAIKAYTIRRVENELWSMKLAPGGDANLHLCKMFNLKTELADLNHTVADTTMVDMLLQSLPDQTEFENLKSSIYYGADPSIYSPKKVRELILAATARQKEFRGKRGEKRVTSEEDIAKAVRANEALRRTRLVDPRNEDHIRSNCPDKSKVQEKADDAEQKRKPRGNCTLRQETTGQVQMNHELDEGVVAGVAQPHEVHDVPREHGGAHGVDVSVHGEAVREAEDHVEGQDLHTDDAHDIGIVSDDKVVSDEDPAREAEADSVEAHLEDSDQEAGRSNGGWRYLNTASNWHVTGNFAEFVSYTADSEQLQHIRGVTSTIASRIAGMGTVAFTTEVNAEQIVSYLNGVLYILDAEYGLFSPGLAFEQGYTLELDNETRNFTS